MRPLEELLKYKNVLKRISLVLITMDLLTFLGVEILDIFFRFRDSDDYLTHMVLFWLKVLINENIDSRISSFFNNTLNNNL